MNTLHKISAVVAVGSFALVLAGPIMALAAGPAAINLGSAGNYVVLAKTGVSTTGATSVVGNIGLSPAAASYITGFALALPSAGAFSTSAQVIGNIYAPDYAGSTPANVTTAVSDMQAAYTDGMARAPNVTELGAGNLGGLTLTPGVYKWGTGITIPTDVTLSGGPNDVWIFQIAQNLSISSGAHVVLSGGAQASNVYWVVAGQTTIGTTAVFNGNILDQTAIVLNTGAVLNGRALAQTAVTLNANAVTLPTSSGSTQTVTPTPVYTPTPTPYVAPTPSPAPMSAYDMQVASLQTQVAGLSATLQGLQQTQSNSSSAVLPVKTITEDLTQNSSDTNVTALQQFLIAHNTGASARALGNVGATGFFGPLTVSALAEFQANAGISPAVGYFGPITRSYIATHY